MEMHFQVKCIFLVYALSIYLCDNCCLVEAGDDKCGEAVQLTPDKKPSHKFGEKLAKAPCTWQIFGTEGCDVELSCDIDVPENEDCDEQFVKITDGSIGMKKFCGKTKANKVRAADGLRDLFVVMEAKPGKSDGVSCTAKCVEPGNGGAGRLPKKVKRKIEQRCACGLQNKDDRIVGGEDAKMNEFPWQAAIVYPKTRSPFCGSTVINERHIFTAAHCFWFEKKQGKDVEVLIHAHTLDMTKKKGAKDVKLGEEGSIQSSGYDAPQKTDKEEKTQRFQVKEIVNHPLFNAKYDYDFAILRLDKKINLAANDAPTPICLPPVETFDSIYPQLVGKNLTVAGWGMSAENAGGTTRVLQKLDVPYIEFPECIGYYKKLMTRRMICAGYKEGVKDACTGDSGGPLIYQQPNKRWWQMGVVSWGEGCAREKKPGVYSRVTEMMQWVHFVTQEDDPKWCADL